MKKWIFALLCVLAATPACAKERYKPLPTAQDNVEMDARLRNGEAFVLEDFLADPASYHWTGFYEAASRLLAQDEGEDALTWYYVGQIRGRVAAGLDPDPSRNDALLSSLNYGLGKPLEAYANEHPFARIDGMQAALAWDKAHPLPANPRQVIGISDVAFDTANFKVLYQQVREGLAAYREQLAAKAPSFRTKGD